MEATHGATTPVVNRLTGSIREYSLYQALGQIIARLREHHPQLDEQALYELVEFQANPGLGFPGSDIERLEFFEEQGRLHARLHLNLLALCGSASPLPAFYAEQALRDGEEGTRTRAFLDLFHHRLQRLLLPVWRRYRYYASFRRGAEDDFSQRLFALIGLGSPALRASRALNWKRLLPYLGLLSLRGHSAALVEAVLRYYFKHARLHIEQCVERRVDILAEQLNRLGLGHSCLGNDLVIGRQVRDRAGKFRIHVCQLDWQRFHDFLPGGSGHEPLCALVRFTLRDPLDYDIRLQLRHEELRELRLGEHNPCRLGWTSWLGRERADGVVTLGHRIH
ncbi:type VI secretion system baseplate subunit TssG [Pseudomonas sp. DTU_2021_1001937_2_SI_NGA_ILE_001]|uniref:type VI secretion system baseplate subunit TssG n=1 Tax=Pseudomonas sp. DTU_2021_1001937_2_SI_NGA_ILE_001 TaxID=3077589 RepID=UPI0028FC2E59|nr:type VI secretion system baseplate subunit TssG [Pseudomonas sp. DTU_2021_1001937_2_SI_NGA_ILE_001]WNW09922.1 type VI secretion system baseplate subunit TssG [Pseudomonas sp. DTU_2021_1001937_2_SI_NGA_ILE_001]